MMKIAIHSSTAITEINLTEDAQTWGQLSQRFCETHLLYPPRMLQLLTSLHPDERRTRYQLRYGDGYATIVRPAWNEDGGGVNASAAINRDQDAFVDANVTLKPYEAAGSERFDGMYDWARTRVAACLPGDESADNRTTLDVELWIEKVGKEDPAVMLPFAMTRFPFPMDVHKTNAMVVKEHPRFKEMGDAYFVRKPVAFRQGNLVPAASHGNPYLLKALASEGCPSISKALKEWEDIDTGAAAAGAGSRRSPRPAPEKRRRLMLVDVGAHGIAGAGARLPACRAIQAAGRSEKEPATATPLFASSSSIFAAACRYNSLLETLDGSDNYDAVDRERNSHDQKGAPLARVKGACSLEQCLNVAQTHFGGCPIFEKQFDSFLSNADSLSPHVVERAIHMSVRHLCNNACFLRAYNAIREFTFWWRDARIDPPASNMTGSTKWQNLTKAQVFSGWSCKMIPPVTGSHSRLHVTKKGETPSIYSKAIFISPDGSRFETKNKATNYLNEAISSMQCPSELSPSPQRDKFTRFTTPLINTITQINSLYSPFGLLEELFLSDPWKLLVSAICLNVTARASVDRILNRFLHRWPDAETTAGARWKEIEMVISPLGLGEKRAKGLIRFSQEYLVLTEVADEFALSKKQVQGLHFVGEYGWTAYKLFILQWLPSGSVKVCDHALQLYVEYQLGRRGR